MPTTALGQIDVGGPCKISDNGVIIYFEGGVKLTPHPTWRASGTSVGGEHDDTLVDLYYTITGTPKAVWNATYQGALLPAAYTNWTVAGARLCGAANRTVSIIGSDGHGFDMVRGCLTKMPTVYAGVGKALYGEIEYTCFIGQGMALTDAGAFYTENTTAWTQADYPTSHQEQVCTAAWGAVAGWTSIFAEDGFGLSHDFGTAAVKQGNMTVDFRIQKYRAMLAFLPQQPTTAQLLAALAFQGAGGGVGMRRSANAADFVVAGTGLSITVKSAGLNRGLFVFDAKANRPGEFGMITAQTLPGTRLVLV